MAIKAKLATAAGREIFESLASSSGGEKSSLKSLAQEYGPDIASEVVGHFKNEGMTDKLGSIFSDASSGEAGAIADNTAALNGGDMAQSGMIDMNNLSDDQMQQLRDDLDQRLAEQREQQEQQQSESMTGMVEFGVSNPIIQEAASQAVTNAMSEDPSMIGQMAGEVPGAMGSARDLMMGGESQGLAGVGDSLSIISQQNSNNALDLAEEVNQDAGLDRDLQDYGMTMG